ncbi:hypothetical protein BSIN_0228 [Burkholderia singularis]|uniref:Uncharacterized protein n=1 Tax=Burkholderia singularis TaxID=1503053 RepID=A0A238H510_9BURK|nr:hypothetical protein BSIN_0228 [Burkholderia singularis]
MPVPVMRATPAEHSAAAVRRVGCPCGIGDAAMAMASRR